MPRKHGRAPRAAPLPLEPLTAIEQYAMDRLPVPLDPANPNVQAIMATVGEILWEYARTHTAEEIAALKARVEFERPYRRRLFLPRPVPDWEQQRAWITKFGVSVTVAYELEDPC